MPQHTEDLWTSTLDALRSGGELLRPDVAADRDQELAQIRAQVAQRGVAAILSDWRRGTTRHAAVRQHLQTLLAPSVPGPLRLSAATRVVFRSLDEAPGDGTPAALVLVGAYLAAAGERSLAHDLGALALELASPGPERAGVLLDFASGLAHWRTSLAGSESMLNEAAALADNDSLRDRISATRVRHQLIAGRPIGGVAAELETQLGHPPAPGRHELSSLLHIVRCLQGRTRTPSDPTQHDFREAVWLEHVADVGGPRFAWHTWRAVLAWLDGHHELCAQQIELARACRSELDSSVELAVLVLIDGMLAARRGDEASLREHWAWLKDAARECPVNFESMALLLRAELDGVRGDLSEQLERLESAVRAASRGGLTLITILANLRAAAVCQSEGLESPANAYLRAAVQGLARWGATGLADRSASGVQLNVAHSVQLPNNRPEDAEFDLVTLLRASQAISSESELTGLLQTLLDICLETSDARRAVLLVEESGHPVVRAEARREWTPRARTLSEPLQESHRLPSEAVTEARTGRHIVNLEAALDRPPTLLLPLVRQASLVGLLALERGGDATNFTPDRVRILTLLSVQMAAALQQSLLLEELLSEGARRSDAESRLAASERRYQALWAHAPDAFLSLDAKSLRITRSNEAAERLLGTDSSHIVSRGFLGFVDASDQTRTRGALGSSHRTGRIDGLELTIRPLAGEPVRMMLSASIVRGAGTLDAILCVLRDISALAQARAALEESHQQLERQVLRRTSQLDRSTRGRTRTANQLEQVLSASDRLLRQALDATAQSNTSDTLEALHQLRQQLSTLDPSAAAPTADPSSHPDPPTPLGED